jgi:hypothetical protein
VRCGVRTYVRVPGSGRARREFLLSSFTATHPASLLRMASSLLVHIVRDGLVYGPRLSRRECIGIAVSIAGNVLISLSLNLQKLAHRRLALVSEDEGADTNEVAHNDQDEETLRGSGGEEGGTPAETDPLLPLHTLRVQSGERSFDSALRPKAKGMRLPSWRILYRSQSMDDVPTEAPAHIMITPATPLSDVEVTRDAPAEIQKQGTPQEGSYLRSKLWCVHPHSYFWPNAQMNDGFRWLGFLLMNVGEGGNFISYGFAPASIVAPLGTVGSPTY